MTNSLQGAGNVAWTLFNGFRVKANKERLEQLQYQSEGNATLVIENTIQGIILNYYQAKLQDEKIQLLQSVIELSRQKWEYQKLRQDMGVALTVDLLQYESAFYQDSTNLIMQQLAYDNAIRNLNLLMGVDESLEWDLTNDIEVVPDLYDFEVLKEKMLSSNQNIKNEFINLEILARDITLAKATMYPVIGFNAGAQYQTNSFKIGDFDRASGTTINYYANFTLNFTLYDGGKVKRGIKALEVQNEVNEIQLDKLKSTLSSELKTHFDLYEARLQMFELTKKSFQVAKQNFKIATLKENSGLINSFAFRDIEMAYLTTGLTMIETGYNLIESQTNLAKLTGGLLDE
jgi:outer membrane protein TolC